jgi:NAD(P)H dehydrogenase (quinone)
MVRVIIIYDSRTGNTEKMAYAVTEGVREEGVEVEVRKVDEASVDELPKFDGIIFGSPVYYGQATAKIKEFIDISVKHHGKLEGMVGAAFTSSGGVHSGAETTLLSLIHALLIHGMVVQGASGRNHYGAVAVGAPDEEEKKNCREWGRRVARLVKRLQGR